MKFSEISRSVPLCSNTIKTIWYRNSKDHTPRPPPRISVSEREYGKGLDNDGEWETAGKGRGVNNWKLAPNEADLPTTDPYRCKGCGYMVVLNPCIICRDSRRGLRL